MDISPCRLPCKASGGKYADFTGNLYHDSDGRINGRGGFRQTERAVVESERATASLKHRGREEASLALCYM
jgi:hypothetical protein